MPPTPLDAEATRATLAHFRHTFDASPADVDGLGHVSNIAYVRWLQDVAVAHSAAVGYGWEAYQRLGAAFVVRRHEIDYLVPVMAGDRIAAETYVASWRGASSERRTRFVRASDGVEVARGLTLWAFVSLDGGRPRRIPPELRAAFEGGEEGSSGGEPER